VPVNVLFERARRTSPSVRAFLDYLVESTETGSLAGMSRFGEALGAATGDTAYVRRAPMQHVR